jgi:hypothetical protein
MPVRGFASWRIMRHVITRSRCGTPAVTPWRIRGWIPGPCRPTLGIAQSIRPRGTPRWDRGGSRTFGGKRRRNGPKDRWSQTKRMTDLEYKGFRIVVSPLGKGFRANIFPPGVNHPLAESPANLEKSPSEDTVTEAKRVIDALVGPRSL